MRINPNMFTQIPENPFLKKLNAAKQGDGLALRINIPKLLVTAPDAATESPSLKSPPLGEVKVKNLTFPENKNS